MVPYARRNHLPLSRARDNVSTGRIFSMQLKDAIIQYFRSVPAEVTDKKGLLTVECVLAERKTFLSKKKLTYIAKVRVDEEKREVRFTEMLKESGFGLSDGDIESSPGFGFKKETYKTGIGPREGSIEEQSSLFGKKYRYAFDFKTIRHVIEQKAQAAGFVFRYQITPIGI